MHFISIFSNICCSCKVARLPLHYSFIQLTVSSFLEIENYPINYTFYYLARDCEKLKLFKLKNNKFLYGALIIKLALSRRTKNMVQKKLEEAAKYM